MSLYTKQACLFVFLFHIYSFKSLKSWDTKGLQLPSTKNALNLLVPEWQWTVSTLLLLNTCMLSLCQVQNSWCYLLLLMPHDFTAITLFTFQQTHLILLTPAWTSQLLKWRTLHLPLPRTLHLPLPRTLHLPFTFHRTCPGERSTFVLLGHNPDEMPSHSMYRAGYNGEFPSKEAQTYSTW